MVYKNTQGGGRFRLSANGLLENAFAASIYYFTWYPICFDTYWVRIPVQVTILYRIGRDGHLDQS